MMLLSAVSNHVGSVADMIIVIGAVALCYIMLVKMSK